MKALLFAVGLLCFAGGGMVGSMIASPTPQVEDRSRAPFEDCIKVVQKTKVDLTTCVNATQKAEVDLDTCVRVTNNLVDLTNQFMSDLWTMPVGDLRTLRKTTQPKPLPKLDSYE